MNKTELLNKLARDNGERLLLARALDKLELARQRNIPACTGFLSPQERASVENLLNTCGHPRHLFFGGYEGAERTVCAFLPDWQEAEDWQGDGESCPVRALRCTWSGGQKLTHRDFLGSILGLGLDREKVGDLLVGDGRCDVLALEEVADFLVFHMEQAGRVKLKCSPLPLDRLEPPAVETRTIRDTVSSPAAGRGGRLRLLPVPGQGRRPDRLRPGAAQPPGMCQARPRRGPGGRAELPGAGQVRAHRGGRPVQKGAYSHRIGAVCIMEQAKNRPDQCPGQKAKSPEGLTPEETAERGPAAAGVYRRLPGQPGEPVGKHLYRGARRHQA